MSDSRQIAPDPEIGELHYHDEQGRWMVVAMPNEHAAALVRLYSAIKSDWQPQTLQRIDQATLYLETRRALRDRRA